MSDQLSLAQIKRAYHQAAKIVARYGDKYLPIFERLEKEYNDRKDKGFFIAQIIRRFE